jgi:hypothetical protein
MATTHTHAQQVLSDSVLNGALAYISSLPMTTKVYANARNPAQSSAIQLWESTHNLTLPPDLRDFYKTQDGFTVTWKAGHESADDGAIVGKMEIKPIAGLIRATDEPEPCFVISGAAGYGDCFLVYKGGNSQIKFRDTQKKWYELMYNALGM